MNRAGSSSINHCARDLHARFSSQATRRQRTVATDVLFCSRVSTRSSSAGSPVKMRRAIFLGCHWSITCSPHTSLVSIWAGRVLSIPVAGIGL